MLATYISQSKLLVSTYHIQHSVAAVKVRAE